MEESECEEIVMDIIHKERPKHLLRLINEKITQNVVRTGEKKEKTAEAGSPGLHEVEIHCWKCKDKGIEGTARAFFSAPPPAIVLCANRLENPSQIEEALVHELIHTYDYIVSDMDIKEGKLLACSEVRAAREAECYETSQFFCKSNLPVFRTPCSLLKQYCTRRIAERATKALYPDEAEKFVKEMFTQCYNDKRPFQSSTCPFPTPPSSSFSSSASSSPSPPSPKTST